MLTNNLKVAWRHIRYNKTLSFLNIFGLAIGMAFAIMIGFWIDYETSFDAFHTNGDRIAMVMKNTLFNDRKNTMEASPLPLYHELKEKYPEVEHASRMTWGEPHSLVSDEQAFKKNGRYVDPNFLEMFSFKLLEGNKQTALNDPNSIILTERLAELLFRGEESLGRVIRLDDQFDLQVTGIIADVPDNSTIQFDYLAPYEFVVEASEFVRNSQTNWGNNFLMNVVELKEGASMEALSKKISGLNMERDRTLKNQFLFLHPLDKWHLENEFSNWVNAGGKIQYIKLFGLIGIFILIIACINFMNLSTARSEKRAKEVGIRKAVGSQRIQLILQFLTESMLIALFALIFALIIITVTLPYLGDVGFENISFGLNNVEVLVAALSVCLFTGLIAGSYPAIYLSSLLPVRVLKGIFRQSAAAVTFRKVLVISQFAISIGLIICTIIVFQQINHARNRSIGYDPNNLISVDFTEGMAKNYQALKQEVLNTGYFEAVAKASQPMTRSYNKWSDFSWDGKAPGSDIALDALMTEWDFEKAAGLKFKLGRPFSRDFKTDLNGVILNEEALKVIGYKDPIGRKMKSGNREVTIVGVVENMIIEDPFKPAYPLAILFNADAANNLFLRLKPEADLSGALAAVGPLVRKYNSGQPFEYTFVDEEYAEKFKVENQVGKLAAIFAALAILISCLGLFGLAMFMAERRVKEIGIRKVLGATAANVWLLLSREFIALTIVACLIASPLSFWFMKDWLQKYDYRIDISYWVFILAGLITLVITLITVSSQAVKVAICKPVKSLRAE